MPKDTNDKLVPRKGEVKVRLYGQGLGDCFLIAFPRGGGTTGKDPCYMVIDCGAAMSTPHRKERARRVVADIHAATGGHLDVLVVTHQHFDHISGFDDAWDEWKRIKVDALYLPWTEAMAEVGEHKKVNDLRKVLDRAAQKALERATQDDVETIGPGFRAQADFLGVGIGGGGPILGAAAGGMDATMERIRSLPTQPVQYFHPGDVFRLPGTDCHGYVLGPPLPGETYGGKRLIELLVDEDEEVMYSYRQLGMPVDDGMLGGPRRLAIGDDTSLSAMAAGLFAQDSADRADDEGFCPFGPRVRLDWDAAMDSDFFRACYGKGERGENGEWRRVDDDWLGGAGALALRASGYTNNLSMVLAFDVPNSEKMLLFPGDAQVGNWLSWHRIRDWRLCAGAEPRTPPKASPSRTLMQDLLARVAFYKVGHHGSHNATIRKQGLEAMTHPDLVAYLPVSVPVAQDLMGYCPMPFYPVVHALHRCTKGRVFLPNGEAVKLGRPDDRGDETLLKEAGLVPSKERMGPLVKDKQTLEKGFPLYLELTIAG